jgi:hypothetical protein
VSRAAAAKVTGELTVAPLVGEQMFTVLSTEAVQLCPDATLADAARRAAARKKRVEITVSPPWIIK